MDQTEARLVQEVQALLAQATQWTRRKTRLCSRPPGDELPAERPGARAG